MFVPYSQQGLEVRAAKATDRILRPLRRRDGRPAAAHDALFPLPGRRPAGGRRLWAGGRGTRAGANVALSGVEVSVDLANLIDVAAEARGEAAGIDETRRLHRRPAEEAGEPELHRPRPGRRGPGRGHRASRTWKSNVRQ